MMHNKIRERAAQPGDRPDSPFYNYAYDALKAAHEACFKHPDRPLLGMSHGPFSGVNEALGIIAFLEDENRDLKTVIAKQAGASAQ